MLRECAGRPIDLVARLGGEEFGVLLPHQGSAEAIQVAERCLQAVEAAAIAHAGIAGRPACHGERGRRAVDPTRTRGAALLAAADAALYLAKRQGRRRVVLALTD